MFESVDTLDQDLRQFALDGYRLPASFKLGSSEVGKALLQLAAGKSVDALANEPNTDGAEIAMRRDTANQFVSSVMLAPDSNYFTTLGVSPDADSSVVRDNFRRLMALVHPDAKPVGFPSDAASRVNRAYAVLSESGSRAAYAARELGITPFGPVVLNAEPVPRRTAPTGLHSGKKPSSGRFSGLVQTLRARQSLLWIAALLLLPIGAAVTSLFSYEAPKQLVEGPPKSISSPDVTLAVAAVTAPEARSPTKISSDSQTNAAIEPAKQPPPGAATSPTPADGEPPGVMKSPSAAALKYSLTLQESAKGVEPASVVSSAAGSASPSAAPAPPVASRKTGGGQVVSDSVVKAASSLAPVEPTRSSSPDPAPPPAAVTVSAASVASGMTAASSPLAASDRVDAPASRVKPSDAEAIVVRFSNAYESGSIQAFAQLFAPGMSSRRQMLSDYERVFSATRQRTIKFNQLKHAALGERLATSGYAVVTTTDQDNRTVTQRVFLEFEIGRDRGEPRIERLANYVIN